MEGASRPSPHQHLRAQMEAPTQDQYHYLRICLPRDVQGSMIRIVHRVDKPLIHPISIHKFHQYDRYRTTKSTHQTAFQPTIRQAPSYGDLRPVGIRILPQRTPHQRNYRIIASSGENRQQKVRFMITFATFFERRLFLYQRYSKGIRSRR